ncbi:hypothetical protein CDAR_46701 [Caerostris darwini]|uniref:Uncharacterized protein n=1 Tax=Caerostris darwini TaxID=1538125 RepID=A0AAV4V6E0_9ARAC|nr:hypothetical protein CDAR_46701 [Caerostris darwini]
MKVAKQLLLLDFTSSLPSYSIISALLYRADLMSCLVTTFRRSCFVTDRAVAHKSLNSLAFGSCSKWELGRTGLHRGNLGTAPVRPPQTTPCSGSGLSERDEKKKTQ